MLAAHHALVQSRVSWEIVAAFRDLLEEKVEQICGKACDVRDLHLLGQYAGGELPSMGVLNSRVWPRDNDADEDVCWSSEKRGMLMEGVTPPTPIASSKDANLTRQDLNNDIASLPPSHRANMAILRFSLSAEATGRMHEQLVCLAKFGESVSIEARKDKVSSKDCDC